jgi:hypothetical protein
MQSMGVCSLNHDTVTSYRLGQTAFFLKFGLGWEEAHHPWSKNKRQFTASELLNHLCEVVIPLQDVKESPSDAPFKLPIRPDSYTLGTKSDGLLDLTMQCWQKKNVSDSKQCYWSETEGKHIGFGDQLIEMQQTSWAIDKIHKGSFKIDMCFSYGWR